MTLALFCKFTKLILKNLMLSHKYVFFSAKCTSLTFFNLKELFSCFLVNFFFIL